MKRFPILCILVPTFCSCILDTQTNSEEVQESIYLNNTEGGLDSAYNQSHWANNIASVFERYEELNKLAVSEIGRPQRIQYGSSEVEQLDLFTSKSDNAPIHIFIHGGAWRTGNGSGNAAYNAQMFVKNGIHYVAPDYLMAPDAGGSLFPMVEQLRRAVTWVYNNASEFGGDKSRIFLSGHSAGGHLAGVLLTTDWAAFNLPEDVIKGAFIVSGMFDLHPVSLSSRNEYVTFTAEMVEQLSPVNYLDRITSPVVIAYGTNESPEFKRQSEDFVKAMEDAGKKVELYLLPGYNHFEIMISLGNPYELPGMLMLRQIRGQTD